MDYKKIEEVNRKMTTVDIKGKAYCPVNNRVLAFRELYPEGTITTEIISLENGVVVMKSTILDEDGKILATGLAYEKETSSFINKTSYIENCETSAIGRALGFLGLGIDDSIASAEEVDNAIRNQEKLATKSEKEGLKASCKAKGVTVKWLLDSIGFKVDGHDMTAEEYGKAMHFLSCMKEEKNASGDEEDRH